MNRELTLEIVKEFFKDKPLIERVYLFGSFERREETEKKRKKTIEKFVLILN